MTNVFRTVGRPARRPASAARICAGLLALLGFALATAPAYAGEPALPLPPELEESGGVASPAVPELESGGVVAEPEEEPAPPDAVPLPAEAEAPGSASAPVEESVPVAAEPPEAEPAPDEQKAGPVAPAPVTNINVNIRVLSPGDDGDVVQQIVAPTSAPESGGESVDTPVPDTEQDWEWNWSWDCGSHVAGAPVAASAGWEWNWNWACAPPELDPTALELESGLAPPPPLGVEPPVEPREPAARPPAPGPDRAASAPRRLVSPPTTPVVTRFASAVGVAGVTSPAAPVRAVERPTPPGAKEGSSEQRLHWQPLVGSAASTAPPGGSPAPLLVLLLAALSLLVPRATEAAGMEVRRLRSLISARRLERPG